MIHISFDAAISSIDIDVRETHISRQHDMQKNADGSDVGKQNTGNQIYMRNKTQIILYSYNGKPYNNEIERAIAISIWMNLTKLNEQNDCQIIV